MQLGQLSSQAVVTPVEKKWRSGHAFFLNFLFRPIISNSRLQRTSVMSVSNRSICWKIPSRTNFLDKYWNSTLLLLVHLTYIWKESLVSVWRNLVCGFAVWRRSRRVNERERSIDKERERGFATHIEACIKSGIKRKLEVNNILIGESRN